MKQVCYDILDAITDARDFAIVTVVYATGSTPRKTGSRMLVFRDGKTVGTIGGGKTEADICGEAVDAIIKGRPKKVARDLSGEIDMSDPICGGSLQVFIEPFEPRK